MLTVIKNIMNIFKVLNRIGSIAIVNDDIHIKFKGDLLLESNNLFLYSKDGVLVTKHKVAHFNPIFYKKNINLNDTKVIVNDTKAIHDKQDRLNKMMLHNLSLGKKAQSNDVKKIRLFQYTE